MKISNLLDENSIELDLKSNSKEEVISELVGILQSDKRLRKTDEGFAAILEKAKSAQSSFVNGVAISHTLIDGVKELVMCLGISKTGIVFDSPDNEKSGLVLLLLSPLEESETHLQILSRAEGLFQNKSLCDALLSAHSKKEVINEIINAERKGWDTYINLSEAEILFELGTREGGLSEEEASRRLKRYGPNILEKIRKRPLILRFTTNLTNLFAILLWIAGILAFIANLPQLGLAILAVIVVNALFSFWQEYKAEKAVEGLRKLIPSHSLVLRNGKEKRILTSEIVPGDVIILGEGDKIPADGRLFEAFDMRVDNSALTGESRPIYKISEPLTDGKNFIWTEIPNLVFGGTSVLSGIGKAIVIATGMHSEIGKIARLTQVIREELSPLQKELINVTKVISVIAVCMGVVFFILGNYVANLTALQSFIFAIGIIVANVPEGLLPTVSLALAMAVQRMARRNVIIKRLSSVETLGCTTVICTDKTGTLTTNQVSVVRLWSNNKVLGVSGSGYDPAGEITNEGEAFPKDLLKSADFKLVFEVGTLCNNAQLKPPSAEKPYWNAAGDPTEGALLTLAQKAGFDYKEIKSRNPRIFQLSFDSVRKRMSTINETGDNRLIACVKGAPGEVLSLCNTVQISGKN